MIRLVLERALLFALPFILFIDYRAMRRGRLALYGRSLSLGWLAAIGLGLVIGSFALAGLIDDDSLKGRYVPPQNIGGKIVPAHIDESRRP